MNFRSHEKWTIEDERDLIFRFHQGTAVSELAEAFGRSELAIRARLAKHLLLPPLNLDEIERPNSFQSPPATQTHLSEKGGKTAVPLTGSSPPLETDSESYIDVQIAFRRFHFVYGIVNRRSHIYVGYSQDVWHRISQHNKDLGAVATRNSGPWFPFTIYCFAAEADARSMETLIRQNFGEFALRAETSIREVLAQVGISLIPSQIRLL